MVLGTNYDYLFLYLIKAKVLSWLASDRTHNLKIGAQIRFESKRRKKQVKRRSKQASKQRRKADSRSEVKHGGVLVLEEDPSTIP